MSLHGIVTIGFDFRLSQLSPSLRPVFQNLVTCMQMALADGTGNGQANAIWHYRGTIDTGHADPFNLYDNSLHDIFGNTLKFTTVRAAMAANLLDDGSTSNNLSITGSLALQADVLPPGGVAAAFCPRGAEWTTAVADTITVTNNGSVTVPYELLIIGTV